MQDFEALGAFYLGRREGAPADEPLLYDSRDLTTHGVCIGMTGSGKTGLCLALLEEAAIDGIPVLAIDPKGDLPNLLLTFPRLAGADFAPWIDPDAARRAGSDVAGFAAQEAQRWRDGLAGWGQDGARIERLRAAAEVAVYTPGASAGIPLAVLAPLAAPAPDILAAPELLAERVDAAAGALLGLLGIDGDALASREHLLVAQLLTHAWSAGRDLDLPALIAGIQRPPVARIGVMEVDSLFPPAERFAFAMRLNTLLASPQFALWSHGEPPDPARLLSTPDGRPRIAIVSIAHLGERERMFVVATLLAQVLAWTRRQAGTSSLRAILYFDEIAGYLPPVANPPSKPPLLTLLKQARAFGVGVLMATQNPVDLDYKALANCGTWFVGKLQTERDRARALDALEGASASGGAPFDRAAMERVLAGLGPRRFLLHDVHEEAPVVFQSRWCLSYLRGPMTREQIAAAAGRRGAAPAPAPAAVGDGARPALPPTVAERFLPVRSLAPHGARLRWRPWLAGHARVAYRDAKQGVDTTRDVRWRAPLADPPWSGAEAAGDWPWDALAATPDGDGGWGPLPAGAATLVAAATRAFADTVARVDRLALARCAALALTARPDEDEGAFRARVQQAARERRDADTEALRRRWAPKLDALAERIRRAEAAREREAAQVGQADLGTALSFGATLLGALFGRKAISAGGLGRAASTARAGGRSLKERQDVARAEAEIAHWRGELATLDAELAGEVAAQRARWAAPVIETTALHPRRTDVVAVWSGLLWEPVWTGAGGDAPAWR